MRRSTTWYQKPVGIPSANPASSMTRPMLWNTWGVRMVTKYPRRPIPVSATRRKTISCMRQRVLSPHHPDVLSPFRRRSPADSAVGSSAPPGSHAAPPAILTVLLGGSMKIGKLSIPFICIMLFCLTQGFAAEKKLKYTGTFSNLEYNQEGGDLLGMEIKIVPTKKGYQGALQIAEGGPSELMVVDVFFEKDNVKFEIPISY